MVKHSYGAAKGKYLIPGGFSEEGELPQQTAKREVFEETGVVVEASDLVAVRFTKQEVWCIFRAEYIEGEPTSDHIENEEALFMSISELLVSEKVVETTKEIVRTVLNPQKDVLRKSDFVNAKFDAGTWQLYM